MSDFVERLRAFELKCQRHMGELRLPVHLCLGQEEVPEALHGRLRTDDWLFSTHRSHGHYAAKGGDLDRLWDEIIGSETGINGGFSGSQCFSDPKINFHASAIVGGLIGVAAGTALALKLSSSESIVVCCMGDGATEQGIFWETLNFAALHALPLLFICENNDYSVHAHISSRQATPLGPRVAAFGVTVLQDIFSGLDYARDGFPAFVEAKCVRIGAHVSAMEDLRERPPAD